MWTCFEIRSLNDLAVIDEDKFYFSNDRKYCYVMEILFRLPFGSVGFYNGNRAELLEEDLFIPNGLALSRDKKYVESAAIIHVRVRSPLPSNA